jgi:D-alanyl-D-alanine dipeptidase
MTMRSVLAMLLVPALAAAEPADALVDLGRVAPGVRLDVRYATAANFTKQVVYPAARCVLRRAVAERLARVQAALAAEGLGLKVYDCYRPLAVQRRFWALMPDERYVADPKKGSRHNRGAAVDLTLVDARGAEVEMPSAYDEFGPRAHRDYAGGSAAARGNRERLAAAMAREGFVGLPTEWWHFDAPDWRGYPLADVSFDAIPAAAPPPDGGAR